LIGALIRVEETALHVVIGHLANSIKQVSANSAYILFSPNFSNKTDNMASVYPILNIIYYIINKLILIIFYLPKRSAL
jgi:hypothetical protein